MNTRQKRKHKPATFGILLNLLISTMVVTNKQWCPTLPKTMKVYAIVCFAALMAADACAHESPIDNLISEITGMAEDGAAVLHHSFITEDEDEEVAGYCKHARAKLQKCTNEAAGEDPKFQQSIMTTGKSVRACTQRVKHHLQKDKCFRPFNKLLQTKCPKELGKLRHGKCEAYSADEFDEVFHFLEGSTMSCRKAKMKLQQCFNENANKDHKWQKSMIKAMKSKEHCESTAKTMPEKVKCGAKAVKTLEIKCSQEVASLLHGACMKGGPKKPPPSMECLHSKMLLKNCVKKASKGDKIFNVSANTAAKAAHICLQTAAEGSVSRQNCEKQLKALFESKCPTQTDGFEKACSKKKSSDMDLIVG